LLAQLDDFLELALADIRIGMRMIEFLGDGADDLETGSLGQARELLQRRCGAPVIDAIVDCDQQGPFAGRAGGVRWSFFDGELLFSDGRGQRRSA
jgi:hypothetical protein